MEHEHEEVEQIPWAMLADRLESGRRRSLGLVGLVVVAALVTGVVAVNVLRRPSGTTVDLAPGAATPAATGEGEPPTEEDQPAADPAEDDTVDGTTDAILAPTLYTEADLMAGLPAGDERLAAARAEWFVADFFTVLGDGDASEGLAQGLPAPHPEAEGYSWVEWVRASSVVALQPGLFDVTVVYRTLVRGESGLVRTPVRAVGVEVRIGDDGSSGVAGLPVPRPLPPAHPLPPVASEDPPADVAAAALAHAADLGTDAQIEGGVPTAEGWSVYVSVVDVSLVRWPYQIDIPPSGPES